MDDEIQVAQQVAATLRTKTQRVYELCRTDPSFPVILIGQRQYRFSKRAIQAWLEAGGSKGGLKNENEATF